MEWVKLLFVEHLALKEVLWLIVWIGVKFLKFIIKCTKLKRNLLKKAIILTTLLFTTTIFAESFNQSKKLLKEIYKDHQTTFYCGCKYNSCTNHTFFSREGLTSGMKIRLFLSRLRFELYKLIYGYSIPSVSFR